MRCGVADRVLLAGEATGAALVLDEPLSMWGGLDAHSGRIIDHRHPQVGETVTGRVLVMPTGRGSSSAASVIAEAIRLGTAPAAIVMAHPDDIVLVGALVAEELYGITCPIVVVDRARFDALVTGDDLTVGPAGLGQNG
jgi:predicted aconitase with swiveling domain